MPKTAAAPVGRAFEAIKKRAPASLSMRAFSLEPAFQGRNFHYKVLVCDKMSTTLKEVDDQMAQPEIMTLRPVRVALAATLLCLVCACGGGGGDDAGTAGSAYKLQAVDDVPVTSRVSVHSPEDTAIAAANRAQAQSERPSTPGDAAKKEISQSKAQEFGSFGRIPIFRFYNTRTNSHFYTASVAERDSVIANQPVFVYEGVGFAAHSASQAGMSAVYRFFNIKTGTHFYTVSEIERDTVIRTLSATYQYEGPVWYAETSSNSGNIPMYRFYGKNTGAHFYTISPEERARVASATRDYSYDGVGYYAWQADSLPLPVGGQLVESSCRSAALNSYLASRGVSYSFPPAPGSPLRDGSQERALCDKAMAQTPPFGAPGSSPAFIEDIVMVDYVVFDENGKSLDVPLNDASFIGEGAVTQSVFSYLGGFKVPAPTSGGAYSAFLGFDQSGSIASTDPRDVRIDAGQYFLRNSSAPDEVGVGSFSDSSTLYYPASTGNGYFTKTPESDFAPVLNGFRGRESGSTPLYDAVFNFSNIARLNGGNPNKAVVIFSDGMNTSGTKTLADAIANAQRYRVKLFTFALDSTDQDIPTLQKLAQETGGAFLYASTARQLISMYGSLGNLLRDTTPIYRTAWRVRATPQTIPGCFSTNQRAGGYICTVTGTILINAPSGPIRVRTTFSLAYRVI